MVGALYRLQVSFLSIDHVEVPSRACGLEWNSVSSGLASHESSACVEGELVPFCSGLLDGEEVVSEGFVLLDDE